MTREQTRSEKRRPGRPRHVTPSADYLHRRHEIVEVAAKVFEANGYDSGSLDEVAEALGLRKASLYYYVRSKSELLYLVFDRAISISLGEFEEIAASEPPVERLSKLVRRQIETVAADPSLFSVFFDQRPHLEADYETEIRTKERRYLQLFVEAVTAAIDGGAIDAVEPRYAAQLLLGMANWTYKWLEPGRDDIDQLADTALRLVFDGARRPRSRSAR